MLLRSFIKIFFISLILTSCVQSKEHILKSPCVAADNLIEILQQEGDLNVNSLQTPCVRRPVNLNLNA